ncbi:MAG TPA: DUF6134 family protein [Chitinophagaceae bacterium]|jgi:uncharacterized protein DUF6134|nr:DUF6134 family protein [Chitinophagaceae bacterium]
MIPVLIIWLIRRYREKNKRKNIAIIPKNSKKYLRPLSILLLFVVLSVKSHSQNKALTYQIVRNGNKVGTLRFSETSTGDMDHLKMESDVKTRFVFTFTAHSSEEAVYYNGILLRSSIYRKLNGTEKANKQHQAGNQQYIIHAGEKTEVTKNYPITYNMLSLYSREPENISQVYSDNFQSFIAIQKTDQHKYKITLPDGNYNYYYYKNGVLSLVEVHHSLYSANIVLIN